MTLVPTDDGVSLYVHQSGPAGGRTVLLLHGWPLSHRMFDRQLALLPEAGIRCVAPDLRGFGRSDAPADGYGSDRLADDLRDLIAALGLERFVLAAYSSSAAAAVRYMSRHAGSGVSGLVLISPAAPALLQPGARAAEEAGGRLERLIRQARLDRPRMAAEFAQKLFYRYHSPEYMSWFSGLAMDSPLSATLGLARALELEPASAAELARIAVPAAVFYGAHDRIVPPETAQELAAAIPGVQAVRFDKSGHGLFQDEAERFQQELERFVRGLS
ncbi:alpha/beta hydrolase [Paenibacillus albicereus]|uniref:Alpha/beta hydrolase n=1 Tax=Paenibacillus albicereus TaxID=2726185 RepID=A0A6H2GUU1_9BACL|nr:alpha/beta hydrolase [Paenibacillus albicereus]QJC50918.1 alpha/beta hydrolase [Paenibacillus albicereus]